MQVRARKTFFLLPKIRICLWQIRIYARLACSDKNFSALLETVSGSRSTSVVLLVLWRWNGVSNVGARFYPSGCGGHKNSGNVATFSEFLGGRKNLAPACPVRAAQRHRVFARERGAAGKRCERGSFRLLQAERGVPGALLPSQTLLILNNDGVGGFAVDAAEVIERGARALGGNHAGTDGFFG